MSLASSKGSVSKSPVSDSPIYYDPKTKAISIHTHFIEAWPEHKRRDFEQEVNNWNHLTAAYSKYHGPFPPSSESVDPEIDKQIFRIMNNVTKELDMRPLSTTNAGTSNTCSTTAATYNSTPSLSFAHSKKESLIKQLTQVLALIMSKPPWEPVSTTKLPQLSAVLAYRCDIHFARHEWADAYADSEVLTTFNPQDWKSHLRKARCLKVVEKYEEALSCLAMAKVMARFEKSAIPVIESMVKDIERCLSE